MNIEIAEDWRIKVIPLNFELQQRVESGNRPDGTAPTDPYKWQFRGYYSGLKSALTALPDHLTLSCEGEQIEALFTRWEGLCDKVARSAGK